MLQIKFFPAINADMSCLMGVSFLLKRMTKFEPLTMDVYAVNINTIKVKSCILRGLFLCGNISIFESKPQLGL